MFIIFIMFVSIYRGVSNNLNFLSEIVRNYHFRSGDFTTKFIGLEYPKGFKGVELTKEELSNLTSAAYVYDLVKRNMESGLTREDWDVVYNPSHSSFEVDVVTVKGTSTKQSNTAKLHFKEFLDVRDETKSEEDEDDEDIPESFFQVKLSNGSRVTLDETSIYDNSPVVYTSVDNEHFPIQVLGETPKGYKMMFRGAEFDVKVRPESVHDLTKYMKEKKPLDTSKFIMAPMAGALVRVYVEPGQTVAAGQPIAIVEAMKMQNKLVAEKDGKVKSVKAIKGDNVSLNQIIVEFEH